MSKIVAICFLVLMVEKSSAQIICKPTAITIQGFLDSVKSVVDKERATLSFIKFVDFDFGKFQPIKGKIGSDHYEIGFNKKGQIEEITHYETEKRIYTFKLIVYEFKTFRIALLKLPFRDLKSSSQETKYFFTPVAFLLMKETSENYMVNLFPQFGTVDKYHEGQYFDHFPILTVQDISCIMALDKNLYPISSLRFSNGRIVMNSFFKYQNENPPILKYELIDFFITESQNEKLKLDPHTCFFEIIYNIGTVKSDFGLRAYPKMRGYNSAPVWIFTGAHDYE